MSAVYSRLKPHEVFQLIAFAHSMLESGCSARMASGFVRRMCAIYQLGEDQRAQLLAILRESRGE